MISLWLSLLKAIETQVSQPFLVPYYVPALQSPWWLDLLQHASSYLLLGSPKLNTPATVSQMPNKARVTSLDLLAILLLVTEPCLVSFLCGKTYGQLVFQVENSVQHYKENPEP